ncbi:hypothetical protein SLA2020_409120 [Shorea laevis]
MTSEFGKDFLPNAAAGTVVETGKAVCKYANQMIKLWTNMKRNYETLKSEAEKLQARRCDYQSAVQSRNMETESCSYILWLASVEAILKKVENLKERYQNERTQLKFSVMHRAGFSDQLLKVYEEVHKLVEEVPFNAWLIN